MELLKQIAPKFSKDIVGNKLAIKSFIDILKNPQHSPKVILLVGPIGCGKTTICKLLFNELNFKVYELSSKDALEKGNTFIVNKTIDCFEKNPKRKILFIDDVDILINTERSTMTLVDNLIPNLIRTNTFLVLTSKLSEEKTVTAALKKSVEVIKLTYPTVKDAFAYLSDKLEDQDDEELLSIVKKQRGNIRDILLNLKNTEDEMDEIVKERGYGEYNNFEIISSFFLTQSWDNISAVMNTDPSMVSYLLYENVLDDIYNNREATAVMKSYQLINSFYIKASIIEKFMQDNLDWSLYNTVQIVKVGGVHVALKDLKKKTSRKETKFRFSQVLSKLSHKNIMQKKLSMSKLPLLDFVSLVDSKQIKSNEDTKQIITTYHKYFV
jgi:adenylate kinase family enzyme